MGKPRSGAALTRRRVLGAMAGAAAAPWIIPASALGKDGAVAPSQRLAMAILGLGDRGTSHTQDLLPRNDAQIVAVCDPYESKREAVRKAVEARYAQRAASGEYKGCTAHADFREIMTRPDVDAVVVAAPENWHALLMCAAVRAGKDVYGEKALSLTVAEGRAVVEAVRRHGRVFQVGTQQRSGRNFRHACELALNGYLGKLHTIKVGVPGGRALPNAPAAPVPPGLDYEMWLGPAVYKPYNPIVCTFNWYFVSDYCAGWIQSWGVHHIDTALWGAPEMCASTIEVEGTAVFPQDGLADTSSGWRVTATAPNGLKLLFGDDGAPWGHGIRFEGDEGWVHVDRGGIQAEPKGLLSTIIRPTGRRLQVASHHMTDFIESVRSRRDPVAPVEAGHAATTFTLVSDIATRLGRKLTWDWKAERFVNDEAANRMLSRPMRSPWSL